MMKGSNMKSFGTKFGRLSSVTQETKMVRAADALHKSDDKGGVARFSKLTNIEAVTASPSLHRE